MAETTNLPYIHIDIFIDEDGRAFFLFEKGKMTTDWPSAIYKLPQFH